MKWFIKEKVRTAHEYLFLKIWYTKQDGCFARTYLFISRGDY